MNTDLMYALLKDLESSYNQNIYLCRKNIGYYHGLATSFKSINNHTVAALFQTREAIENQQLAILTKASIELEQQVNAMQKKDNDK